MRPLLALARLEWSVLGPARLGAVLVGVWTLLAAWTGEPEHPGPVQDLGETLQQFALLVQAPFAFALGLARLAPEFRDGYADHLDRLPVGRATRWAVKVAVGALLLAVPIVATAGALHIVAAAAVPRGGEPLADLVAPALLAHAESMLATYALGLAAGWIGATAWILVPLVAVVTLTLNLVAPWTVAWSPVETLWFTPELTDGRAHVRAGPLAFVAVGIVAAAASSLLVFQGPAALLVAGGARVGGWMRAGATGCGGLMLGTVALASVLCGTCGSERLGQPLEVSEVGGLTVLHPRESADADALLAALPAEADRIRARFGLPDALGMDVELTSGSRSHAGMTTPTKIRMSVDAGLPTLRHELAHAATQSRLGNSLESCDASLRFFAEGIAEDVELLDDAPHRAARWRHAAAIVREGGSDFAALLDPRAYVERRDEHALYSLGFTFVDHLRATRGDAAVLALVDAFGARCDSTLRGLALWHLAAAEAGFELPALVRSWRAALRAVDLPARPVLAATIRVESGRAPLPDAHVLDVTEGVAVCRFRSHAEAGEENTEWVRASSGRCPVPDSRVRWDRVHFQLGYELGEWEVFGAWQEVEVGEP